MIDAKWLNRSMFAVAVGFALHGGALLLRAASEFIAITNHVMG